MDSEFIKAEAIQKIIDRINLKTPLVKDIKVVYRKEIDYYNPLFRETEVINSPSLYHLKSM